MSEEETILLEAEYYMRRIARTEDGDGPAGDGPVGDGPAGDGPVSDGLISISLNKLMAYPQLQAVCPDVKRLRYDPFELLQA